ncbi:MAG: hypothetical protein ACREPF_11185 [Rhodanobacteraceae bacterium]
MRATERVVVSMTPGQKARAKARADALKISLGEYMRRRAFDEGQSADEVVLRALAGELNASTTRAARALDATIQKLDAMQDNWKAREKAARKRAMREFASVDLIAVAGLLREPAAL